MMNLVRLFGVAIIASFTASIKNFGENATHTWLGDLQSSSFIQVSKDVSDSFMKTYFYNLDDNFTFNSVGCCSYVAMEMLLSYHDIFTNSTIVDDSLIQTSSGTTLSSLLTVSPGPVPMGYIAPAGYYASYYTNYIQNDSTHLFASLVRSANSISLYNQYVEGEYYYLQLHDGQIPLVLNRYLYDHTVPYYSISCVSRGNSNYTQNQVTEFVADSIDNGSPVLVGIYDQYDYNHSNGHACIAYDYDYSPSAGYTFYYNAGWQGSGKTHAKTMAGYDIFEATIITFSGSHSSHSQAYRLNQIPVCPCQFCMGGSNATHHYTYSYQAISDMHHWAYCMCGSRIRQMHGFVEAPSGGLVCSRCGATITL